MTPRFHERLAFRAYMLYLVFAPWRSVERELERIGKDVARKVVAA